MIQNNADNQLENYRFLNDRLFWCSLLVMAIPCFFYMTRMPIQLWDESRLAINAVEMSQSKNWWITTFEGQIDTWNTKPPLLIWMQALLIRLIGINILAIRLPTAIAGFLTGMLLYRFVFQWSKSNVFAFFSIIILFTAHGYVREHTLRTGDYDALLVLFTTLYSFSFFNYLHNKKQVYLYSFFACIAFAVLTKSIAGLFLLPSLGLYSLYRKQLGFLFSSKHFYIGLLSCISIIAFYYLGRELIQPGYLDLVVSNEWSGRFMQSIEEHHHPFYYYFNNLSGGRFSYWFPLFLIGIFFTFYSKDKIIKRIGIFSLFVIFPFLIIISSAQTKLLWYDAPAYPFLAIVTAIPLLLLFRYIRTLSVRKNKTKANLLTVLLSIVLIVPYIIMVHKIGYKKPNENLKAEYAIPYYIEEMMLQDESITIASDIYNPHYLFPILAAKDKGKDFKLIRSESVTIADTIVTNETEVIQSLKNSFLVESKK